MIKRLFTTALLVPMTASTVWMSEDTIAFQKTVQPFLEKNCSACHNDKQKIANLSFDSFRNPEHALKQTDLWENVLDKLSTGKMPPPGPPKPAPKELAAVTSWIETLLSRSGSSRTSNPGRVTARRLNRTEYNNTIRDLLGVSIRPADEFPVDDSGYGFDNIGDVLAVSPMLMEKYMTAAASISKLAVFGEQLPPKPH